MPGLPPSVTEEALAWKRIENSKDPSAYLDYLQHYGPDSLFSELAQHKLDRLTAKQKPAGKGFMAHTPVPHDPKNKAKPVRGRSREDIARAEEAERQHLERERLQREQYERERAERDARAEADRLEQERAARAQLDHGRAQHARLERDRAERERIAEERAAAERAASERAERERYERDRMIAERTAQERLAQERLAQERVAQERLAHERAAQERAVQERAAQERMAQERMAQERMAQERSAQERALQERALQERAAQERAAKERFAEERLVRDRAAPRPPARLPEERSAPPRTPADRFSREELDREAADSYETDRYSRSTGPTARARSGGAAPGRGSPVRAPARTAAAKGRRPVKAQGGAWRPLLLVALLGGGGYAAAQFFGVTDGPSGEANNRSGLEDALRASPADGAAPGAGEELLSAETAGPLDSTLSQGGALDRDTAPPDGPPGREEARVAVPEPPERYRQDYAGVTPRPGAAKLAPPVAAPQEITPPPVVTFRPVEPAPKAAGPEIEARSQPQPAQPAPAAPAAPTVSYVKATWLKRPSSALLTELYPDRAVRMGMAGRVILDCAILLNGRLSCQVKSETPGGSGFGQAAMRAAESFVAASTAADGRPAYGQRTLVPITFDASAGR